MESQAPQVEAPQVEAPSVEAPDVPSDTGSTEPANYLDFDALEQDFSRPSTMNAPHEEVEDTQDDAVEDVASDESEAEFLDKKEALDELKEDFKKVVGKDKGKTFRVKSGDSLVDVSADSEFVVKVDGSKETVKLTDLMENYSGKANWDRKYNELALERKAFESERATVTEAVNELHSLMVEQNDPIAAIEFLADAMGADPIQVRRQWQKALVGRAQEEASMTDEQRQIRDLQQELEIKKRLGDSANAEKQRQADQVEIQQRTFSMMNKHGLNEQQVFDLYNEMLEKKISDPENMTPEMVGEYYAAQKDRGAVEELAKSVNSEASDLIVEELLSVKKTYPDMTMDDLKDIAIEVWGDNEARVLSKKIKQSKPRSTTKDENAGTRKDPVFFDDLD